MDLPPAGMWPRETQSQNSLGTKEQVMATPCHPAKCKHRPNLLTVASLCFVPTAQVRNQARPEKCT